METPSVNQESLAPDTGYAPTSVIAEHYRVERELGRGGMATVYLCTDLRDETKVAIKVLRHEIGSSVVIERFLREIAFASELDHPQIPKVLGSGVIDGLPYYVMTYINGESLKKRIMREAQLPIPDALKIMCDVIEPTAYAHKRGIVHRDLKPDNILISDKGVFVLDFGIARAIVESGGDKLTSTGIGVGTPSYMSPEQALGDRALDVRSDVYSLGCVLYEMLAGIPPFVGPTAQVIISRRFAAPPPPLREVRDNVPESVEAAISKALAKAPADRWPNVTAFGNALKACMNETGARPAFRIFGIRRATLTRAAIGVGLVAVASIGILAWTRNRGSFDKGEQAIRAWDFPTAEAELRKVVAANGDDPKAQLWLAQTLALGGSPVGDWRGYSSFASAHATDLTQAERDRAAALSALAAGNYADACARFGKLSAAERTGTNNDFISTLTFGDCLKNDLTVIADKASQSGYSFQASYQLADSVYESLIARRAATSAVYGVIMPRLQQILTIDKSTYRGGHNAEGERFQALPRLKSDTLAFTPYRVAGGSGAPWRLVDAGAVEAALTRNRARISELAGAWASKASSDSRPHQVLARILEANGELSGAQNSALDELRRARSLTSGGDQTSEERYVTQLQLGTDQVRLYLRLNQFDQAAALADSLLSLVGPKLEGDELENMKGYLSPLAALTGRANRMIQISQLSSAPQPIWLPTGQIAQLPRPVIPDYSTLEAYAEVGAPADSIIAVANRVSEKIAAVMPPAKVEAMRAGALSRPFTLAAPNIGANPVVQFGPSEDPFLLALRAYSEKNLPRARVLLDSLEALHSDFAPGEITMDAIYLEAWLHSQIGQRDRAASELDRALRGLSAALPSLLRTSYVAACLVRVMALRADLATAANQHDVARTWASAVVQLWGHGDALTQPTVERMRKLL